MNCSSGYRIDNFPFLRDLSTVACEIFNSTLKGVARHDGFMGVERFLLFTKHYIKVVNERRIDKVTSEMHSNGPKREVWKTMNALIYDMQQMCFDDTALPCSESRRCVYCM